LNAEEVRAALCQKVDEADLNKQQKKKKLMDLLQGLFCLWFGETRAVHYEA